MSDQILMSTCRLSDDSYQASGSDLCKAAGNGECQIVLIDLVLEHMNDSAVHSKGLNTLLH